MIKRLLAISGIIILQTFCNTSFSQNDCGNASLENAEELYSTGAFDECIEKLENCLNGKGYNNNDQKAQAYRLLALCYLAIDSVNEANANIENLLSIKVNFEADSRDPERFRNAVESIRSKYGGNIVSSVSKRNEDIRLAPATTAVITEQEIKERGYNDLIELLKDLPGFDISIYYGRTYANVYQRGLRTNNTEKTLILIDGVEDNDLWSNIADISQQYPITNIKRVEVIYGPASTMYGPNAFSGVINIITKEPADYLKNNHPFGIKANAGIGSHNTKYLDISTGFKKDIFSFSLTGRFYNSDRPDLSSQDLWEYNPDVYDTLYDDSKYIKALSIYDSSKAQKFFFDRQHGHTSNLYDTSKNSSGNIDSIILTPEGVSLARSRDKLGYDTSINSQFKNDAHSAFIGANINIGDLKLGFVYWAKNEGAGTSWTDNVVSVSGTRWMPSHKYFYVNYSKRINDKLLLSAFSNYRVHTIRNGSKITSFTRNYYAAQGNLNLDSLVKNPADTSSWITRYYYEQSKQFRAEFKFLYTPSSDFYLVGGLELRNSELQGDYLRDTSAVPQEVGTSPIASREGDNHFDINDVGIYAQGRYSLKKGLGFTVGLRLDHNQIRQNKGFGYRLSPRFVIDYSIKEWVFKAIYSRGIENVSNFTKYATTFLIDQSVPNPDLKTESISNYEISASNKISAAFSADIDFYYSIVKDVVAPVPTEDGLQNQHSGQFEIKGVQSNLYYKSKSVQVTISYSYTKSVQTKGQLNKNDRRTDTTLTVADIAPHKLNVIVNYFFLKHFNANFRINCVDSKKVGYGTTAPANPSTFPGYVIGIFPGYVIANFALTAENFLKLKGLSFQFICNNIFDKEYYSPGIYTADGITYPDKILQMGRNFSLRIGYEF